MPVLHGYLYRSQLEVMPVLHGYLYRSQLWYYSPCSVLREIEYRWSFRNIITELKQSSLNFALQIKVKKVLIIVIRYVHPNRSVCI